MVADRLKTWVIGAIAASSALLLALGFGITWAQLHSEKLPGLSVLSALPNTYFIGAALQTALVPLAMATLSAIPWIALSIKRRAGGKAPYRARNWAWLGLALVLLYRLLGVQTSTARGRDTPAYLAVEALISLACILLAVGVGDVHNIVTTWRQPSKQAAGQTQPAPGPQQPYAASRSINTWALVGPLVAAIMLLSTLTAGALDIADTLQTTGVLPVAQVVLNIACTDISDGKPPYPRQAPEARDRCLIGGYYVGENSTWVYLVKRENSCPGHQPVPARLVELRRSEISEMVILAKPECPRDSRCGEC